MVTDGASAFVSEEFQALCKMLRVAHKTTLPHHPQAHGIVERHHQEVIATAKKVFIDIDAATDDTCVSGRFTFDRTMTARRSKRPKVIPGPSSCQLSSESLTLEHTRPPAMRRTI